jgi:PST family polysaccharide transporter
MIFLENRPILTKIIRNLGWQTFDKIFRMGIGVFVSIFVIRYLGPTQFGAFSYAIAFVGMFIPVAGLGLDRIIIRDISKDASQKDSFLGTAFMMKMAGGIVTILIVVPSIWMVKKDNELIISMTIILALGLFFYAWDVIDFWFQSQIRAKFSVLAKNSAFLITAIFKILLVLGGASLITFAVATTAEMVLGAVGLTVVYRIKGHEIKKWKSDCSLAKKLLAESWPLIISGFAILIYMRIDQIMLGSILGDEAVGVYAAAVKFSEIWYFIPLAVSSSVLPVLVKAFKNNKELFFRKYQNVFNLMTGVSIGIAVIMTFLSNRIVKLVFGPEYSASGPILAIHIWAGIFVFIGMMGSVWTMINSYQKFMLFATVTGAFVKITLNAILIPRHGTIGAAIAMVISQAIASYCVYFMWSKTRKVFFMMTRAIFLPWKFD